MKFNGITKKGREYLAKIQAENKPINFSKIKIGDGRLDNYDNPAELEHLINQKVDKGILTLNQENDTVILTTNIDNVSLRTGYYPREIGVFVNDNGQEIMYYYMNDGDETSWIPPETDGPFKIELKLNLIASNAQSIIVEGSGKELYITKEFLEANYTQKGGYTGTAQEIDDRLVSAVGKHDGDFPIANAVVGNVYYSELTKKYYKCKVGGPAPMPNGNFIDMSILENLNRLENLTRKTILLFYNGGSLIPNGTTSIPINEDWYFFGIGVGTAVQSGKERMCFLFRNIFQSNNDILRFNGIEIRYNATNKTLTVSNNGGNLYFLEQYSSLT
ncbi:phage tail protein [Fusobacterium animalis]|uniref:phage tail-collar fiber domain-containing protein n=1 Tax=Fusobacterium animalis TaxID=76859 RepID=UPI0030D36CCD